MKRFGMVLVFSTMTATAALAQTAPNQAPPQKPLTPKEQRAQQFDMMAIYLNRWSRDSGNIADDASQVAQHWQPVLQAQQQAEQQITQQQSELAAAQSKYDQLKAILKQKGMDVEETNGKVAVIEGHMNWNDSPHGPQSHPRSPAPR